MKKMIGKVGRTPCEQLRGLLHSQKLILEEAKAKVPPDEEKIRQINRAIENTMKKLEEKGC